MLRRKKKPIQSPDQILDPGNHTILILGRGGEGKTYFAKYLLTFLESRNVQYFIFDPIGQYGDAYGTVFERGDALRGKIPRHVVFQWRTKEDFDFMSNWLYQYSIRRNKSRVCYVLIEEAQISIGLKRNHPLINLVLTGRGNKVNFIIVNRALLGLSSTLFDSATCIVMYNTPNELTLKRIRDRYGIDPERIKNLNLHEREIFRI